MSQYRDQIENKNDHIKSLRWSLAGALVVIGMLSLGWANAKKEMRLRSVQ